MKAQVRLLIAGKVQGVFFRANTQQMARNLSLKGWVKNLFNGNVEIVAEGEKENLDQFVDWCRKGPQGARVKDAAVSWREYTEEFSEFNIVY